MILETFATYALDLVKNAIIQFLKKEICQTRIKLAKSWMLLVKN